MEAAISAPAAGVGAPPTDLRLWSSRLCLRPWTADDAEALAGACGDQAICSFTTVPRLYSTASAVAWIERQERRLADGSAVVLAIVEREAELPIGTVWLFEFVDHERARAGCWLLAAHRRRGFGSEAVERVCHWAFEELALRRVLFEFPPIKEASRGVSAALGATRIGERMRGSQQGPELVERWVLPAPAGAERSGF